MAGRVKRKHGEKLTADNIEKVIEGLNKAKPITKKVACEMLNISYNTSRLNKIIEEHLEWKALDKRMRDANRGKPAQPHEIVTAITGYLDGRPLADIAGSMFRPLSFVKGIIDKVGVPQRMSPDYLNPPLLPEQCVRNEFEEGQIVWSARYQAPSIVLGETTSSGDFKVYKIYVIEEIEEESPYFPHITGYGGFNANQAAHELGSLEHLQDYGVDIYKPYRQYFSNWLKGNNRPEQKQHS